MAGDLRARAGKQTDRRLYTYASIAAAVIVLVGFSRTYFLKSVLGAPALSSLLHVHGLVMTAWFGVFIAQARLVAARRVDLHRRLGWFAAGLAVLVVILGCAAAISGAAHGKTSGGLDPLVFLMIPLSIMLIFAALTGTALLHRRHRPDIHKRLMLLASLNMLTPAISRIPLAFLESGGPKVYIALTILLVVACVGYDTIQNRRLHPAYGWGAGLLILSFPLRMVLANTETWRHLAAWLTA